MSARLLLVKFGQDLKCSMGEVTSRVAQPAAQKYSDMRYTIASDFNSPRSTSSASGDAYADFLLGDPSSTDVAIGEYGAFQIRQSLSFCLREDWKVTQRLTMNYGIRYDDFGHWTEIHGCQAVSHMQTGKIIIPDGCLSKVYPVFHQSDESYIEASGQGLPNTFISPYQLDFTSRLGFACPRKDILVLRGAPGVCNVDNSITEFRRQVNVAPFFSYDMTVSRAIPIAERYSLQFRAEIFNLFNVPMLGNRETSVVSPVFTQIRTSNTYYSPRNLQLGMRLDF